MQDRAQQLAIVQRMIDAGESEANIAKVIQHFKTPQAAPTPAKASGPQHPAAQVAQTLGDLVIGAIKGGGETAINLGQMLHTIPGVSALVDKLYGQEGLSQASFPAAKEAYTQPTNTAQAIGKGAEQIGEVLAGGGVVNTAMRGARLLPRVAGEAVAGAAMSKAQGGSATTGAALSAAGPIIGASVRGARNAVTAARNAPVVQDAVEWGISRGIPVDAATASGVPVVRGMQAAADATPLGGVVGQAARNRAETALAREGAELAGRVASSPQTREGAGTALRTALSGKIEQASKQADEAYEALRKIEASTPVEVQVGNEIKTEPVKLFLRGAAVPTGEVKVVKTPIMGNIPMAVDLEPARKALQPVYDRLLRASQLAQPMGAEARALKALDRLMTAEGRYAPLSVVDDALGDLKTSLRSMPDLGKGAGAMAQVVKELDKQVMTAAMKAGPKAVQALRTGRAATVKKYELVSLVDDLMAEPVKAVNALTNRQDTAVAQLRSLAKEAPAEMPKIGRAIIDDLLETAGEQGGFKHTDKLYADWQKLGDETKKLLYKPEQVKDLDRFFLLAKRMGENANPSGSGKLNITSVASVSTGGMLFLDPVTGATMLLAPGVVSKILHSPTGARLLTRAMTTPPIAASAPGIAQSLMRLGAVQASQGTGR